MAIIENIKQCEFDQVDVTVDIEDLDGRSIAITGRFLKCQIDFGNVKSIALSYEPTGSDDE